MTTQQSNHQSTIVELMQKPDFYPHPVGTVTLQETHISRVFLTGDVVYKIKKPLAEIVETVISQAGMR